MNKRSALLKTAADKLILISRVLLSILTISIVTPNIAVSSASEEEVKVISQLVILRSMLVMQHEKVDQQFAGPGGLSELRQWPIANAAPRVWENFFAGTVLLGNPKLAEPVFAFYNPFLEMAWVTRWQRKANADAPLRFVEAWFESGSRQPSGNHAQSLPLWLQDEQPYVAALQSSVGNYQRRFDGRVLVHGNQVQSEQWEMDADLATRRLALQETLLYQWFDAPENKEAAWNKIPQLLANNEATAFAALFESNESYPSDIHTAIDRSYWGRVAPSFVIAEDDGLIVLYWDPFNPQIVSIGFFTQSNRCDGFAVFSLIEEVPE